MTERQNKRWTAEDDRVLLNQVTRHANNLFEAFRETSRLLDRTESACKQRWYSTLLHSPETSMCFVTIGKGTKNANRKVVRKNTSDNTKRKSMSWWRALLKILRLGD